MEARFDNAKQLLGESLFDVIQSSHVLVVGAGGIGCEVLKNLVMSGFQQITILDLDTIDVSNLNRQFLFRKHHVGEPKAVIARESVLKMNPNVTITALHRNIMDSMFSIEYMQQFHIVLSALDNNGARQYLNRLCMAAGVPIVESGTQGYLGQCYAILHGLTECKDCQKTAPPKVHPVCTIRNTPEEPVHCVVWAKFLYHLLFGAPDDSNELRDDGSFADESTESVGGSSDHTTDGAHMEDKTARPASHSLQGILGHYTEYDNPEQYALDVFQKYFNIEILHQQSITDRWRTREAPQALDYDQLMKQKQDSGLSLRNYTHSQRTQTVLDIALYAELFIITIVRILTLRKDALGTLVFDKDDPLSMDFVACASNLRMYNYHIPLVNEFELMGIAGSIVHAISTTNAIAAGLEIMEAIKIFRHHSLQFHIPSPMTYAYHVWNSNKQHNDDTTTTTLLENSDSQRHPAYLPSMEDIISSKRTAQKMYGTTYITNTPPLQLSYTNNNPQADFCYCNAPQFTVMITSLSTITLRAFLQYLECYFQVPDIVIDNITKDKYIGCRSDFDDFDDEDDDDDHDELAPYLLNDLRSVGLQSGHLLLAKENEHGLRCLIRVYETAPHPSASNTSQHEDQLQESQADHTVNTPGGEMLHALVSAIDSYEENPTVINAQLIKSHILTPNSKTLSSLYSYFSSNAAKCHVRSDMMSSVVSDQIQSAIYDDLMKKVGSAAVHTLKEYVFAISQLNTPSGHHTENSLESDTSALTTICIVGNYHWYTQHCSIVKSQHEREEAIQLAAAQAERDKKQKAKSSQSIGLISLDSDDDDDEEDTRRMTDQPSAASRSDGAAINDDAGDGDDSDIIELD